MDLEACCICACICCIKPESITSPVAAMHAVHSEVHSTDAAPWPALEHWAVTHAFNERRSCHVQLGAAFHHCRHMGLT